MKFATFEDEFTSELDIAELDFGFNSKNEPLRFIIRETGSPEHEKVQRKYSKALTASRRNRVRYRAVMAKIVGESILIDWKGVLDDEGNEVPCTLENKIEALTKYKKLFVEIIDFASDQTNFEVPETELDDEALSPDEDTEKNS